MEKIIELLDNIIFYVTFKQCECSFSSFIASLKCITKGEYKENYILPYSKEIVNGFVYKNHILTDDNKLIIIY